MITDGTKELASGDVSSRYLRKDGAYIGKYIVRVREK
jgi:hypothetical protein